MVSSPTSTLTPTSEASPTPEFTATPEMPQAVILEQANCRYGPGSAYLYSHGLYEGDRIRVDGRNYSGTWLWIQPENLDRHCWASASVMEVTGDPKTAPVVQTRLPQSTLYGPPASVVAERDGDTVLVSWERVWMTEDDDRGYLIEATICRDGARIPVAVQTFDNFYQFEDDQSCSEGSGGLLYTVEKHGYTDPIEIPWP